MAVLTVFFIGILFIVGKEFGRQKQYRVIAFENVGTLRIDDPVEINGIIIAKVIDIHWSDSMVYVAFQTNKPIEIYENYSAEVVDVGVMGERKITLDCGTYTDEPIPLNDTLKGIFVIGPSEALGMVRKLKDGVKDFLATSSKLLEGDSGTDYSLVETFQTILHLIDSSSSQIISVTGTLSESIPGTLKKINELSRDIGHTTALISRKAPEITQQLNKLLEKIESLVTHLEKAVTNLEKMVDTARDINNGELAKTVENIREQLKRIRIRINDLRKHGVPLKLLPF